MKEAGTLPECSNCFHQDGIKDNCNYDFSGLIYAENWELNDIVKRVG